LKRLYGRANELALLQTYRARAIAGDQQLILIEGDPGSGKTALLEEFGRASRGRFWRDRVFFLCAPDQDDYQPVSHAAMAATSRRLYARLGGKQQASETARDLFIDWLSAVPGWGDLLNAIAGTMDVLQRRRRRNHPGEGATVDQDIEALIAASRRRSLILLVDDLERAGTAAIARLQKLIDVADEGAHILIVGAYRPTAPGVSDPPVHGLRRTLPYRGEFFLHLRLAGLDEAAIAEWVRDRFRGGEPPEPFMRWLNETTGGHPHTIEATLNHLLETGAVRKAEAGWFFEADGARLEVPRLGSTFADLTALNPYIADAIRAGSLLGMEFDATTVSRLLERDELAVEDHLALGVHYGVLQSMGERVLADGEITTAYRFPSSHMRAALAREIDPARRAELQGRIAAAAEPGTSRGSPASMVPPPIAG
jgi:predicted ATPase